MARTNDFSHTPQGDYARECPTCGIIFRTDNSKTKYCSMTCYRKADNRRYYLLHKDTVQKRMRLYQQRKRSDS